MTGITVNRNGKIIIAAIEFLIIFLTSRLNGWMPANSGESMTIISRSMLSEEPAGKKLRVAIYPDPAFSPGIIQNDGLSVNKKGNYFLHYGIELEFVIVEDWRQCFEYLVSKKADIIWSAADSFVHIYPDIKSANPAAFFQYSYSRGTDTISVQSGINSIRDLKGKTAVCAQNSPSHNFLLFLLNLNGIKPGDLNWKFTISDRDALALFMKGRADVYAGRSASFKTGNANQDKKILLSSKDAPNLIAEVFIAREPFLLMNKDLIKKFIEGWLEGIYIADQNPDHAIQIISRVFKITPDETKDLFNNIKITGLKSNLSFFGITDDKLIGFNYNFNVYYGLHIAGDKKGIAECSSLLKNTGIISDITGKTKIKSENESDFQRISGISNDNIFKLTDPVSFYFENGSANLEINSMPLLKNIAELADVFPYSSLVLYGFEDEAEDKNLSLGRKRSQELLNLLSKDYKLSPERFVFPENTATSISQGKNNNRKRVDIIFALPVKR